MGMYCHRCGKKNDHPGDGDRNAWCQSCHAIVVKEIEQRIKLPAGHQSASSVTTCEFHVFFIHLLETEQMLNRLKNENPTKTKTAKSKIETTNLATLTPINRVAARVLPRT